jgi:hypothetical protein
MMPTLVRGAARAFDVRTLASSEAQIRVARLSSIAIVIVATWFWLARTTGELDPAAAGLTGGFTLGCFALGNWLSRFTGRLLSWNAGIAFELLLGFFFGNTILFVLTLASPLGIGGNLALVGLMALTTILTRRWQGPLPAGNIQAELGSLVCVLFASIVATLWVNDQQPMLRTDQGGLSVFTVWLDVFIHGRVISSFAQAHGLGSLSDIKLAGVPAVAYHFASYMMPAALDGLTTTTALDSYAAFQLPFGILLVGLAAYVLPAVVLRTTWPAVAASAALIALPDAYEQGFGIRYLSFQFMTQVNLGMLYGIACIAMAWLFMIDACRRERLVGVVVAFVLLAVCTSYKAHLFVANALILMLYPCAYFGRFRWRWRGCAALALTVLFVAVVMLSQLSPRVPTLRISGSGFKPYADILFGGFADGWLKSLFHWLYFEHHFPRVVDGAIAASLIVVASFGVWLVLTPLGLWKARRSLAPGAASFVVLIVVNYMAMSLFMALDDRGIGSQEEFVNRPHAWAFFIVVVFGAATLALVVSNARSMSRRRIWVFSSAVAVLLILSVLHFSRNLQTVPEWPAYGTYAEFNGVPTCLIRSAQYVHDHARIDDVMQDSQFDPGFIASAIAERQAFVIRGTFGGGAAIATSRAARLETIQSSSDSDALTVWATANKIRWYLSRPEDGDRWNDAFLGQAAFSCDDFRVFRLAD